LSIRRGVAKDVIARKPFSENLLQEQVQKKKPRNDDTIGIPGGFFRIPFEGFGGKREKVPGQGK